MLGNNNYNEVLKKVKENGLNLQYASEELKNNKEIVLEAVKQNGWALEFVSQELRKDKEVVMTALQNIDDLEYFYEYEDFYEEDDDDYSYESFSTNGEYRNILKFIGNNLKGDKEIILEAMKKDGWALKYASKELKNDEEVVMTAIKNISCLEKFRLFSDEGDSYNVRILHYASDELKNNKEFMLKTLKKDGELLQYASKELKSDKEVVMTAVKQNGWALAYASDELKNDKDIIIEAIKNVSSFHIYEVYEDYTESENMLDYINDKFLNDKEFLKEAISTNIEFFIEIENFSELAYTPEVIEAVINKFSEYECSQYYDLDKLKENPDEIKNVLDSYAFKEEELQKSINKELDNRRQFEA